MTADSFHPPFSARLQAGADALTAAETSAYEQWWSRRTAGLVPNPAMEGLWLGGSAVALGGAAVAVLLDAVEPRQGGGVVALLLFAAYVAGGHVTRWRGARYRRRWYRAQRDKDATMHGEYLFVLDEDGVSVMSDVSRSRTAWPAFREAHVAAGVLLLRVGRADDAVAIPLRAFADPAEAAAAVRYAEGKVTLPAAAADEYKG